jgi:hypothetical protein
MFRQRYRRPPFSGFINWTDYRWDAAPRPRAPMHGAWNQPRQFGFLQLFLAGLAVLFGVRMLSGFGNRRGSWLGRALVAALLIGVVSAFSNRRSRGGYYW